MKKPIVGQTVWIETFHRRYGQSNDITETKIDKVGNKWFTVEINRLNSFSIQDGSQKPTQYSEAYKVWFTKEDYDSYAADKEALGKYRVMVQRTPSPDAARKIIEILEADKK